MESNEEISRILVETGAFRDLDKPVILTSGEPGIYYINTEKLCQDGGRFNEYGDDSHAMIQHALAMAEAHPTFGRVIDILVQEVWGMFPKGSNRMCAISGGQRRDWIFSGPVAARLGVHHMSLYKQEPGKADKVEAVLGDDVSSVDTLRGMHVVHVADLLTEASSAYRKEGDAELGWVPMLRAKGAYINDLVTVVTRLQGGEARLAEIGVETHPFVAIDEDFLKVRSKYPGRAVEYAHDPRAWSERFLKLEGALSLVDSFNPDGGKLDRARKFMGRYRSCLESAGKLKELESAVEAKYKKPMSVILGV